MAKQSTTTKSDETAVATTASTAVAPVGGYQLPAHLQNQAPEGLETAARNRATPRMKIVQGQSSADLRADFPQGTIILTPSLDVVAPAIETARGVDREPMSESFIAVPVFNYETFEVWSDFDDDASDTVEEIVYGRHPRSDRDREIINRAVNPNLREEPYGNNYNRSYVHSLNYMLFIESGPMAGELCVWSYSKGDHALGKGLNAALMRRGVSIYNNRFLFWAVGRASKKYSWVGLAYGDPSEADGGPFVPTAEQSERYAAMHRQFDSAMRAGSMNVADHDAAADDAATGDGES